MAGTDVAKARPPVIQLDISGNCTVLPTQQAPMLEQLCTQLSERHGGDGRVLAVSWYNKMFAGARTKPTVEEFIQVLYRAYVNELDPMLDQCHAYVTEKNGRRNLVFTVGIDGWLARAAKHKEFEGCHAEAICENDSFEWDAVNEKPFIHRYGKKDRGKVEAGWGRLKRKGMPDLVMTLDRNEFMSLLQGNGRDFLHQKLSKHLTRWLVIRHLIRQAYPKMLQGAMLPEEAGAVTTKVGVLMPEKEKATGPNPDELPKTATERSDLLQEIDDLFTAMNITSDDQTERNTMRRKKAELVLGRTLKHIGLGDLFDTDLVTLRDKLRLEKEGKVEPKAAEVVTPEQVDDLVECTKCKKKKIPSFVAKTQEEKKFPVLCPDCRE